ncbi:MULTISPECIES: hypothetical protein [Streptomyces]|uniref:Uncharacterized protein n=1 Tax=Streptomyces solicathayae TaxID=3081768 RepID=A0ABZ0M3X7_9ACTN|nr:hypothetical protein [Streptomyces sp. HUAS YS2]WOX26404.1 hypothetical protein R2D22_35535 [Streptomyces sp. HUAS YS2]
MSDTERPLVPYAHLLMLYAAPCTEDRHMQPSTAATPLPAERTARETRA